MACWLRFTKTEKECAGCGNPVPVCLAAFTDEVRPPEMTAVCPRCLGGLDRHLWNIQHIVHLTAEIFVAGVLRAKPDA